MLELVFMFCTVFSPMTTLCKFRYLLFLLIWRYVTFHYLLFSWIHPNLISHFMKRNLNIVILNDFLMCEVPLYVHYGNTLWSFRFIENLLQLSWFTMLCQIWVHLELVRLLCCTTPNALLESFSFGWSARES